MRVNLPKQHYPSGWRVEAFREEWLRRVQALPGVAFAGTNSAPPMSIISARTGVVVEATAPQSTGTDPDFANVSIDYLQTMGTPLLRGRNFQETDRPGGNPVVIVSQSVARRYFGGQNPLGKRVRLERFEDARWFTVIGVAGDVRNDRPEHEPNGTVYALSSQMPESAQGNRAGRVIVLVIRTTVDPRDLAAAARASAATIDKDQPVADIKTMTQLVEKKLATRRLNTLLMTLFAALALSLAAVGIFGLVSYSVARRTHEIGIRMALGARRFTILRMLTAETLALGGIGVAAGVAGSLAASRLLASMLYGVKPAAPHILIAAAVFLFAALLAATLLAGRRAMQVDPVVALRHE
jgi:putative ABC transport system permease protein